MNIEKEIVVASSDNTQQRELYYRGTVQGVGFRYTTRYVAARFAVSGYVKNLSDGRVFLVVEGHPKELDAFLAALQNELGSYIEDVDVTVGPAEGGFRGFEIRF